MKVEDLNQPLTLDAGVEKVADYDMSQDVNDWDEDVIRHLHEEYPEITSEDIEVVFKKTDPQKGYGYGFVGVGKENEIKIPIIIKEYKMSPLDVMLHDGKAVPLTQETVKSQLQTTSHGKPVKRPQQPMAFVGPNISARVYPGLAQQQNPSGFPHAGYKYASVLEAIGITKDQAEGFKADLEKDAGAVKAWAESKHQDVLKLAAKGKNPDELKPDDAHPLVEAFIKKPGMVGSVGVVGSFGVYDVQGSSGKSYRGCVFPNVVDFDLNRQDVMIFTGGRQEDPRPNEPVPSEPYYSGSFGAVQDKIIGKPCSDTNEGRWDGCDYIPSGETGFFSIKKGGVALAFIPVKVLSKSRVNEKREMNFEKDNQHIEMIKRYDVKKIVCRDAMGNTYKIMVSPIMKDVKRIGNIIMMPGNAKWVRLGTLIKLKENTGQISKVASGKSVTLRHLGGESFSVEAPWVEDWAKEGGLRNQVNDYLKKYYVEETLPPVFDECVKLGRVYINDRAPKPVNRVEFPDAHKIARDLTKYAATLPEPGLVDTVLSLKFINKDNVNKFVGFLPQLEQSASHLADLLIASRLGLDVEEYPVKTCMENVMEVIRDLKMLKGK
jgi:hypothetical protein